MKSGDMKNFLWGTLVAGGVAYGITSCQASHNEQDDDDPQKTETVVQSKDMHGNIALFEKSRSEIKFALAFVENYYPYIYWCGKAWTTGHGLTILYNADGTYTKVTAATKVPTLIESDIFKGRYLTFEVLPDISNLVKVPLDKNTLLAACMLRFCIGGKNFASSEFLRQLNAGKTGAELAKTLTGWRKQAGVPNRCYFFAALMCGKMNYSDMLNLRAEGCYNLTWQDIFVYENGRPKIDKAGFCEWDFDKLQANLAKARQPRTVSLNLDKKKRRHQKVECRPVKEIVPDYIWREVSNRTPEPAPAPQEKKDPPMWPMALGALACGGAGYALGRRMRSR